MRSAFTGAVLVAAALLAFFSVRSGQRPALPPALVTGAPAVELSFRVPSGGSADVAFNDALSRFIEALDRQGVRVARVLPDPRRATVEAESLDDQHVRRALAHLPLETDPVAFAPPAAPRVHLRLAADAAERSRDQALRHAARTLQARAVASHLCEHPTVEIRPDDTLRLRAGWMDDTTERRLLEALTAPPAPYVLLGRRLLDHREVGRLPD